MPIEKRAAIALSILASLLGCSVPQAPLAPAYDAGPRDASGCPDCPDTGHITIRTDSGQDAGPPEDADVDAAFDVGPRTDAGTGFAITVDGRLTDPEWLELTPVVAEITPFEPFGGDRLTALYFFRDDVNLYVGLEGELTTGDRIVMYVDLGTTGSDVFLTASGLNDSSGAVDSALSIPIASSDVEFAPELGWGTAAMPNAGSAGSDVIGWRRLSSVGSFTVITSGTRSVCTATACETAIALASIGANASSPINLVVRLGRPDVGWSNQTFPTDSSGSPEFIDRSIPVPSAP